MYDEPGIFARCLAKAARFHGHVCGCQVIGVRMALAGLRKVGIRDPRGKDRRALVVVVEIDRCVTDAIGAVTGLTPGKRTLKIKKYGKMAATCVNTQSGRAVRVCVRESSRRKSEELAAILLPDLYDEREASLKALELMDERDLLKFCDIRVDFHPSDVPGPPRGTASANRVGRASSTSGKNYATGGGFADPAPPESITTA